MNSKQRPVTVEDLLRVKRAERPPPEFWADFDREMRVKQLAAIVEPRPWWAPLIRVGARVTRYQLPIGAAAILAVSFVTIREYRTATLGPSFEAEYPISSAPALSHPAVAADAAEADATEPAVELMAANDTAADNAPVAEQTSVGHVSHAVPLLGVLPTEREPSPSERYIAANLAAARAADPRLVDEVFGSAVRTVASTAPVRDPLIQVTSTSVSESRRSRLLTTALPASSGSGDVSVGTSARVVRRLTEDRLYDSISRIRVGGDRVAIKF